MRKRRGTSVHILDQIPYLERSKITELRDQSEKAGDKNHDQSSRSGIMRTPLWVEELSIFVKIHSSFAKQELRNQKEEPNSSWLEFKSAEREGEWLISETSGRFVKRTQQPYAHGLVLEWGVQKKNKGGGNNIFDKSAQLIFVPLN